MNFSCCLLCKSVNERQPRSEAVCHSLATLMQKGVASAELMFGWWDTPFPQKVIFSYFLSCNMRVMVRRKVEETSQGDIPSVDTPLICKSVYEMPSSRRHENDLTTTIWSPGVTRPSSAAGLPCQMDDVTVYNDKVLSEEGQWINLPLQYCWCRCLSLLCQRQQYRNLLMDYDAKRHGWYWSWIGVMSRVALHTVDQKSHLARNDSLWDSWLVKQWSLSLKISFVCFSTVASSLLQRCWNRKERYLVSLYQSWTD